MKEKTKMFYWFLIVIAVIVALIFITINIINKKLENPIQLDSGLTNKGEENKNMQTNNNLNNESNQNNATLQKEGVKITVTKEGSGEIAKNGDMVAMNYTGKLLNGTVFDSNIDPKFQHVEPFVFSIGTGQVIKGWDIGIEGMKVGEKRTLEIVPEYAYGSTGAGGVIPPNATLIFDVELITIKK